MNLDEIKKLDALHVIQSYSRYEVAFTHGKGSLLYDDKGKEYVDFGSGIGVCSLGHSHPHWIEAVSLQASQLAHISNLFYSEPYVLLAKRLTAVSGMEKIFFGNSGSEANEGAIKIARKYSRDRYGAGRAVIVTLDQSFHGRTMAALTATGQPDYHKHFFPFAEGFRYIAPNYEGDLKEALKDDVCAIMVEGIQGEGGVVPLRESYVRKLTEKAKEKDILLIFDEVQTGNGRTGHMFSYQGFGVRPDIVTTAKGLGGGLPIGAVLVNDECSAVLTSGTHGSTFGGNPIACAGANAVLDIITAEGFLEGVKKKGEYIMNTVRSWGNPSVKEVRGKGLMIGLRLDGISPGQAVAELLPKGLLVLSAGKDVMRFLPPLTISQSEIDKGLLILKNYLA